MRRNIIAGNWKMNMLPNEAISFIEEIEPMVKDTKNEVIICVPFTDFFYANNMAQGTNIQVGVKICTMKTKEHIQEKYQHQC